MTTDTFEVLSPTEVDASTENDTPQTAKVRKLCACGCGEEVTGNRALKRGHTLGTGIAASWAPEDLLVLQTAVCAGLMAVTIAMENKRGIPHMELEEAQAIGNPAGRIVARHVKTKWARPGDIADGAAIGVALSSYVLRIFMVTEKRNATNGYNSDSTVSGFDKYTYHPENSATENGATN